MRCERCGTDELIANYATVTLCQLCLLLIIREWSRKREEFFALTES